MAPTATNARFESLVLSLLSNLKLVCELASPCRSRFNQIVSDIAEVKILRIKGPGTRLRWQSRSRNDYRLLRKDIARDKEIVHISSELAEATGSIIGNPNLVNRLAIEPLTDVALNLAP